MSHFSTSLRTLSKMSSPYWLPYSKYPRAQLFPDPLCFAKQLLGSNVKRGDSFPLLLTVEAITLGSMSTKTLLGGVFCITPLML